MTRDSERNRSGRLQYGVRLTWQRGNGRCGHQLCINLAHIDTQAEDSDVPRHSGIELRAVCCCVHTGDAYVL